MKKWNLLNKHPNKLQQKGLILVDPGFAGNLPGNQLAWVEPESDLLVRGLDRIRSMDDVPSNLNTEVATNGSRLRVGWVCFTQQNSASLNCSQSFPNHWNDGAGRHELDQSGEEWLAGQISIVLLQMLFSWMDKLKGNQFESLLFESLHDFPYNSSLNPVGLHHDEGTLPVGCHR